ncbi:hypothetical protein MHYP_G00230490 [Metynnis hypsauchen]
MSIIQTRHPLPFFPDEEFNSAVSPGFSRLHHFLGVAEIAGRVSNCFLIPTPRSAPHKGRGEGSRAHTASALPLQEGGNWDAAPEGLCSGFVANACRFNIIQSS